MEGEFAMQVDDLIDELGYSQSDGNWITDGGSDPSDAHIFRRAQEAGVLGAYVFRTSPADSPILPARPAVYVAEARDSDDARRIHRQLWNLGSVPFLIVVLPHQVRAYTGFDYKHQDENVGLLRKLDEPTIETIRTALEDFYAYQIDSGRIWDRQADSLALDRRVDRRLLNDLKIMGDRLINDFKVDPAAAHALIGKYIYISYLKDRHILSPEWLASERIESEGVFGENATLNGLLKLTDALEDRFNGEVFPLPLGSLSTLNDDVVAYIASVF